MEYTIGSTVFDGWTITKEIGEGGFGKVYEVRNNKGNIETASALKVIRIPRSVSDVKYIRSQGMDDQSVTDYFHGFVDRLVKEIAAMSKLKDHPNIVRYEDHQVIPRAGEFGWDILIRMELLTPFPDYYMDHGLSPSEVCRLGKEMCSALIFCHQQGVIHRDVKPSNLFVNSLGMFKLGDFGVSRTMGKSTGTGRQGTESYMAPEVYLNRHYGASVDIYSLGMMLYQLMNGGRLPFFPPAGQVVGYGDEDEALKLRMAGEAFPPPASASPEFAAVILKACAYDPAERYPDGQALLEDLGRLSFSAEPLVAPKRKTVSFMNIIGESPSPDSEKPAPPAPEPPKTEPDRTEAGAAAQDSRMTALWRDAFGKAADLALGAEAPDYLRLTGSQAYEQLEALGGAREGLRLEKEKWNSTDIFLDSGPYTFYLVYNELSEIRFFSASWDTEDGEGQWGPLSRFAIMPKGVNLADPWGQVCQALRITQEMTDWLSGHPAAWEEGGASYGFSLSAPAPRPEVGKRPGEDSIQLKMARKSQGSSLQFEFAFKRDSRRLTAFSATVEGLPGAYPNGFGRGEGTPPENGGPRFQTKSPFDRLGGKPTGWQQSPLSGGREGPVDGTMPVAKVSVPPHDPDKTEPGKAAAWNGGSAAMNVGGKSGGGWKSAPVNPAPNPVQTYAQPAPDPAKKSGKVSVGAAVGIIVGIGAAVLLIYLIARLFAGGDAYSADSTRQSSAPSSQAVSSQQPSSGKTSPAGTSYTMVRRVDVLGAPQANGQVLGTVAPGDVLEVAGEDAPQEQWTKVLYNGQAGYVQTPLLTINDVGIASRSTTDLCDIDGNVLATVPGGTALIVLGYTARDYGYWYAVAYEGQTYYVDGGWLALSEALTTDRVKEATVRLPLSRTAAQPGGSWVNLETLEPGTALQVYQSLLPGWYIIPVNNNTAFYYVEAIYFQEYFDALFLAASHAEDVRVWNSCYSADNMAAIFADWKQVSPEDAAILAQWELVQIYLTRSLQLGAQAPDYAHLTQEEFAKQITANSDGFFNTSDSNQYFYYWEGEWDGEPGGYSDAIHYTLQGENWFSTQCTAVIERNGDGSVPDMAKEQRERDKINAVALLPKDIPLGTPREEVLTRLGITEEMLEWAAEYGDCRLSWCNVSQVVGGTEKQYSLSLFSNGNLWIAGGPLNADFRFAFDEDGNLSSFSVETREAGLTFPNGFSRAGE